MLPVEVLIYSPALYSTEGKYIVDKFDTRKTQTLARPLTSEEVKV